jgi:tetrahydromethanopterin S-methyltransferase subunit G
VNSYRKEDEPLWDGHPVDYRYELQILTKVRDDECERLERIETKIAVVISGAVAALGFSISKDAPVAVTVASGLYLIPIIILLFALSPVDLGDAPDPKTFHESFKLYPVTALEAACGGIVKALTANVPKIKRKALLLRYAIWAVIFATILVVGLSINHAAHRSDSKQNVGNEQTSKTKPTAKLASTATNHVRIARASTKRASAAARATNYTTATAANSGKHGPGGNQGRRRLSGCR